MSFQFRSSCSGETEVAVREADDRAARADGLRGEAGLEPVVANRARDGRATQSDRVLRERAEVVILVADRVEWRRVLRHGGRCAVQERIADRLVCVVVRVEVTERIVPSGLERVRAGDVGRRHAIGVVRHHRVVEAAAGVGGVAAVRHPVGLLDHRDHVLDRGGLRRVQRAAVVRPAQVHVAPALEQVHADEFEQQPVGDRRRELDVLLTEAREASIVGGFRRALGDQRGAV